MTHDYELRPPCRARTTERAISRTLVFALALVAVALPATPARADAVTDLAYCIRESGARFYGAHWCPYCRKQKERFGSAAHLLPYVECYEPGTRERRSRCREIRSYPTWVFWDGTVRTGDLSLAALAHHTGCEGPE